MTRTSHVKITGHLMYSPKINLGPIPVPVGQSLSQVSGSAPRRQVTLDQSAHETRWSCLGVKPLDGSDFVDIFCFGPLADKVASFRAGDIVNVEAAPDRVRQRHWKGRDGHTRSTNRHVALKVSRPRKPNASQAVAA